MADYTVTRGQTSTGLVVNSIDTLRVSSGGTANATTINAGGVDVVLSGGKTNNTVINTGGSDTISTGGAVVGTVVSGGGVQHVSSGASATDTVVASGGVEQVFAGGNLAGTQLLSGGALNLASFAYVGGGTASFDDNDNVLTVTEGGHTYQLALSGSYTGEYFHLSQATAGTLVTLNSVACFRRGTMILTEGGERPVEQLAIGDVVVTPDGPTPVKWIGRRGYSGRFARGNRAVLPIRVAAGALAAGVPCRDLFVSPKHALLLDGVLVPAEALVNGGSITQLPGVESVEYFHLELHRHAILIADGAPAESFVDDGGRAIFHNAREYAERYPDALPTPAVYCAPRREDGEQVEAIRRRLARRADPAASVAA